MKKTTLSFLFCLSSLALFSQSFIQMPISTNLEAENQMLYTGNVYFNTITKSNLGSQKDTFTNTATLLLQSSKIGVGKVNADTVTPDFIAGSGKVTLTAHIFKCTGTATVVCTPMESTDGVNFAAIPGQTVYSVNPTSLTVPIVVKWPNIEKGDRYYGVQVTGQGTQTSCVQTWWYLVKSNFFSY